MTTEERIEAIRADLNGASGVSRNGERIRSAHAHLDAIQARLHSLTAAAQVAADALEEVTSEPCTASLELGGRRFRDNDRSRTAITKCDTALSLISREGITPGGG